MTKLPKAILDSLGSFAVQDAVISNKVYPESKRLTDGQLAGIGSLNVARLIASLRQDEKWASEGIGYLKQKADLLERMTGEDLVLKTDFAVDHKNLHPDAVRGSVLDSYYVQYGHTTFLRCGRCQHASSWTGRGVTCGLLTKLKPDQVAPYNSPCLIRPTHLKQLKEAINAQLESKKQYRAQVRAEITRLQRIKEEAVRKPLFVGSRFSTYWAFGDRVVAYAYSPAFRQDALRWVRGVVMHASENVVFRLDAPLLDPRLVERAEKELKKWTPFVWSVPSKSPFVLHEWEFDFFTQMDDPFRTRWLDDAMEWKHIYDVATNKHIEADMQRFGSRLASRELARHQPVDQLMTAKEALAVFRLSVVPTTADEVVAAYRARVENPADIALLKRAKDTLLIRIAGPQYVGD